MSVTAIGSATPTKSIESKEIYPGFIALRLAACSTVGSIGCLIPVRKKESLRPRDPAVGANHAEQLRRQNHVAIFTTLAVTDQDQTPRAVNAGYPQPHQLGSARREVSNEQARAWARFSRISTCSRTSPSACAASRSLALKWGNGRSERSPWSGLPVSNLLRGLVLSQPHVNRVPQELVGRPGQMGDLRRFTSIRDVAQTSQMRTFTSRMQGFVMKRLAVENACPWTKSPRPIVRSERS